MTYCFDDVFGSVSFCEMACTHTIKLKMGKSPYFRLETELFS